MGNFFVTTPKWETSRVDLNALSPRIPPGIGKVLVMRKGPGFPGLGSSSKKLNELIGQPTPHFILPHTRYFYDEMLKSRFIIILKIIFPYTNYPAA
jgi:hypothetical protein